MAFSCSNFSGCVSEDWQLSIGDPSFMGWAIATTYALAAVLAVIVLRRAPFAPGHSSRERFLWVLIAGLMTAIALNKQLDLQTLTLTAGRCLSKEQGWYEDRRLVQRDFILVLIALATVVGGGIIWLLRGIVRHNLTALIGLAALAVFIVVRGGHFFHIFIPKKELEDQLVHLLTASLEVLSPILIIMAAWRLFRQAAPKPVKV
jgi:hypothetical protein